MISICYYHANSTIRSRLSQHVRGLSLFAQSRTKDESPGQDSTKWTSRLMATELLKKRLDDKDIWKRTDYASIQVLGSHCLGFTPSLIVNSGTKSYLFNCNEGLFRFMNANNIQFSRIEDAFITNLEWFRICGSTAIMQASQASGSPKFSINSCAGIHDFSRVSECFTTVNTGMHYTTVDFSQKLYQCSNISIQSVVIQPKKLLAYFCSLPEQSGLLDPEICKKLGIPIGKKLESLISGHDVILDDGRTIRHKDVCKPTQPSFDFLVIDCPSESILNDVENNVTLNTMKNSRRDSGRNEVELVFHFSPPEVYSKSRYCNWLDGFSEKCRHVFLLSQEFKEINFIDTYRLQFFLRKLDPVLFPDLYLSAHFVTRFNEYLENRPIEKIRDKRETKTYFLSSWENLDTRISPKSLDSFVIRPERFVERTDSRNIDSLYEQALNNPQFESHLKQLNDLQRHLPVTEDYEPEIVFVGSGSSVCGRFRGNACILINLKHSNNTSFMLDCGEDSYGQLFRHYGPSRISEVLERLRLVAISHHHSDHHLGLIELLRNRRKFTKEQILLILPPTVKILLDFHNTNIEDLSDSYRVYLTTSLVDRVESSTTDAIKSDIYAHLDGSLTKITVARVDHCKDSVGFFLDFNMHNCDMKRFSICYSGDTKPCEDLVKAGQDCDLLIHEATMMPGHEEEASASMHSTSSQAIQLSRRMNAVYTILTHFSNDLSLIPYINEELDDKIGFAFDNMCFRYPSHRRRLSIMKPVLSSTFSRSLKVLRERVERKQAIKSILNHL